MLWPSSMPKRICLTCNVNKYLSLFSANRTSCKSCYTKPRCEECSTNFSTISTLKSHIKVVHKLEKKFKCEYCDFKTCGKHNLKLHSCYIAIRKDERTHAGIEKCEKYYQKIFEKTFNAKQVSTDLGRIDLLNENYIIEIKDWVRWRDAIGQLSVYSSYYPDRIKIIIYFGKKHAKSDLIKETCLKLGIIALDVSEI